MLLALVRSNESHFGTEPASFRGSKCRWKCSSSRHGVCPGVCPTRKQDRKSVHINAL